MIDPTKQPPNLLCRLFSVCVALTAAVATCALLTPQQTELKVPSMQPSHAASLHAAGLGHPDLLLCASESEVAAALAAGLPANMRKRKGLDKK